MIFLAEAAILNGNFTMGATTYSGFCVPDIKNSGLLEEMKNQRRDQKLKVTYYNLSKILISFEPVYD